LGEDKSIYICYYFASCLEGSTLLDQFNLWEWSKGLRWNYRKLCHASSNLASTPNTSNIINNALKLTCKTQNGRTQFLNVCMLLWIIFHHLYQVLFCFSNSHLVLIMVSWRRDKIKINYFSVICLDCLNYIYNGIHTWKNHNWEIDNFVYM
jgi:hypothetical protein